MKLTPEAESSYRRQSYKGGATIDGVEVVELRRHNDDGGAMTELARLSDGRVEGISGFTAAQINFSTIEPGVIKAFHVHRVQTDVWYVPPEDRILLVLADVRASSPTSGNRVRRVLGDGTSRLVRIPPGVAHGCRNLAGTAGRIVYLTDVHFSADENRTDEGRLPWDFLGTDVWEITRG